MSNNKKNTPKTTDVKNKPVVKKEDGQAKNESLAGSTTKKAEQEVLQLEKDTTVIEKQLIVSADMVKNYPELAEAGIKEGDAFDAEMLIKLAKHIAVTMVAPTDTAAAPIVTGTADTTQKEVANTTQGEQTTSTETETAAPALEHQPSDELNPDNSPVDKAGNPWPEWFLVSWRKKTADAPKTPMGVICHSIVKAFADREKTSMYKFVEKDIIEMTRNYGKAMKIEFLIDRTTDENRFGRIAVTEFGVTTIIPESGEFIFGHDFSPTK